MNTLQDIGGYLLDNTESVPVSPDLLDTVLNCISDDSNVPPAFVPSPVKKLDDLAEAVPTYIRQFLPEGSLKWRFLSPSLKVAAISIGEDVHELAFHKIKAGGKAPEHNHKGTEITVVLKGSFSDTDDIYQPGDFIIREPGDIHQPIATKNEECICLSVLAAPIQLTGLKRLLNPFLSFSPS